MISETHERLDSTARSQLVPMTNQTAPGEASPYDNMTDSDSGPVDGQSSHVPLVSYALYGVIGEYVIIVVTPVSSIISLCGNTVNVVVYVRLGLQSPSNSTLFLIAIADYLFMLCVFVGNLGGVMAYRLPSMYYYNTSAQLMTVFNSLIIDCLKLTVKTVTLYFTVTLSLERFIAVYFPLKVNQIFTPKRTRILNGSFFLWSTVMWIPRMCMYTYSWRKVYGQWQLYVVNTPMWTYTELQNQLVNLTSPYLSETLPAILIASLSFAFVTKAALASRWREKTSGSKTSDSRLTMTMTVLNTCTILSILPRTIYRTMTKFPNTQAAINREPAVILLLLMSGEIMTWLNAGLNFFVYVIISKKFKREFIRLFTRRRKPRVKKERTSAVE